MSTRRGFIRGDLNNGTARIGVFSAANRDGGFAPYMIVGIGRSSPLFEEQPYFVAKIRPEGTYDYFETQGRNVHYSLTGYAEEDQTLTSRLS